MALITIGTAKPGKLTMGELPTAAVPAVGSAQQYTQIGGQEGNVAGTFAPKITEAPVIDTLQNSGYGTGSGGTGVNRSIVNAYLSQVEALPDTLRNLLLSNADQYNSVMGGYGSDMATAEKNFGNATTTNEQNKGNSIQSALLAAAQGGRGLRATLAAIGALGGTGELLANRAVAQGANADIGNAKEVFDTNATSLENTWEDTIAENEKRKENARVALANANARSQGDVASQKRDIYSQIAQLYGAANDTGGANEYVARGVAEQPTITAASRTLAPSYDTSKLAFTPNALSKYLGGQNDMSVNVAGNSGLPINSVFTTTKKRDQEIA